MIKLKALSLSCLFCLLLLGNQIFSVPSIVYNLRIAQTTKRQPTEKLFTKPSISTLTPFGQFRKKGDGTQINLAGGLFSQVYLLETFYLSLDLATAYVQQKKDAITSSTVQPDDLLFSGGYNYRLNDRIRFTFSGLLGIPTHTDKSLSHVQFGYGHLGLGLQADNSWTFKSYPQQSLRSAVRLIHFLSRTLRVDGQTYDLGFNLADLFLASHTRFGTNNIEFGYNPSFLFRTHTSPNSNTTDQQFDYIRNSFYGHFKRKFLIYNTPNAFACSLSYGFDARPKITGHSRIVTIWASWSVNF